MINEFNTSDIIQALMSCIDYGIKTKRIPLSDEDDTPFRYTQECVTIKNIADSIANANIQHESNIALDILCEVAKQFSPEEHRSVKYSDGMREHYENINELLKPIAEKFGINNWKGVNV